MYNRIKELKWNVIGAALLLPLVMSCTEENIEGVESDVSVQGEELIAFNISQNSWNRIYGSSTKSGESAVTRSEPISTENLGELYKSFAVTAFPTGNVGEESLYFEDEAAPRSASWNTSKNHYWPLNSALDFFAYAPVENSGRKNLNFSYSDSKQLISFDYNLPEPTAENDDARNQKDLLFAITKDYNKSMAMSAADKGAAPLRFDHALSAIFFQKASSDEGTIKSISLMNVHSSGNCIYDGETFTWSDVAKSELKTYTQKFDIPVSGDEVQEITFYNDESGQRAFMMIPQELSFDESEPAKLKVVFEETGGETKEMYADIHGLTPNWQPGIAYTYRLTIKSGSLDIEIDDTVIDKEKVDLQISNSSDSQSKCYMRVCIIGAWYDKDDRIIAPWSVNDGTFDESFPTVVGETMANNWTLGEDGYYYYKFPVSPGCVTGQTETDPDGDPLFISYKAPREEAILGSNLRMQIVAQGVIYDSSMSSVANAWGEGVKIYLSENEKK